MRPATAPLRRAKAAQLASQHGQALTEFLVAALAVMPLFLLIPLIAKYQDISNSTQLASRYVAFQAAIRNDASSGWEDESQLAAEVVRRFFGNPDAPIKTGDAAGNFKAHQNLFWRDPVDAPLIRDFTRDVRLRFGGHDAPLQSDGFRSADDGKVFSLHDELGLGARGIFSGSVSVTLARMPAGLKFLQPFDTIDLSLSRNTSLLIDPWPATGPAQVEAKLAGSPAIFPAAGLAGVSAAAGAAITAVDLPGSIAAPMLGQLEFWRDVVPEDRLRSRQ